MAIVGSPWVDHLDELLDGIERRGIAHIGAHDGREVPYYQGFGRVVLVEPLPHRAAALRKIPDVEVIEAAVSFGVGRETLIVTDRDEGSSLLPPMDTFNPSRTVEVDTIGLDDLTGVNVLVVDVQGAEVDVLSSPLDRFDLIIVEASDSPRYEGGCTADDVRAVCVGFREAGRFDHPSSPGVYDLAFRR